MAEKVHPAEKDRYRTQSTEQGENVYMLKDGKMVPTQAVGLPEGTTLDTEESKLGELPAIERTVQVNANSNTPNSKPVVTEQPEQPVTTPVRPSYDDWYKTVPTDRNDTTSYNLKRAYELASPEELERWRTATPEQLQNDESYHLKSVYLNPQTGEYEFMKSKDHPTLQGELDFYYGNSPESADFRRKYDLDKSGDYYRYVPANHIEDWYNTTPEQARKNDKASLYDLMMDAWRWAKANGKDFNPFEWAGLAKDGEDIHKTQAENEEDERKAKAKARWDSIGRFIRELGNFVGVAGFGGQSIPSKEASPEEYTARQKQLRDATIAARNAYNKNFFADFTKQMADDYNKQKLEIEKRKQDRLDEDQRLKTRKQDWLEKFQQGRLDIDREKLEIEREYKEGRIKQGEKANALRELEYYRKAAGTTTTTTDGDGNVIVKTTTPGTKTSKASGGGKGKGYGNSSIDGKGRGY